MTDQAAYQRWQATPDLCWTRFADSEEWVVYHPASSSAHLVTEAAHRLWVLVSDGRPYTVESLADKLASETERATGHELIDAIRDTLAFMDRAGLIRPAA